MSDGAAHIDSESCGQDSGAIEETGKRGVQPTTTGPPPSGQGTENGIAGRTSGNDDLLSRILPHLHLVRGPDHRGEYLCWCPFHPDGQGKPPHQPNLQVSVRGFICHACGAKGGLRKLAQDLSIPVAAGNSAFEAVYDYQDEHGSLMYQALRKPGKQFLFRRPDGKGGWIWNLKGVKRIPYRLPQLLANQDEPVYVVEGEKDADRLASTRLVATTNPGGAGKWHPQYAQWLAGRKVLILPDNDDPGREHAEDVARSAAGVAGCVKVISLPGLPEKGDVSDWFDAGHTVGELKKLAAEAPHWEQPDDDEKAPGSAGGRSEATRLVELVLEGAVELFHEQDGSTYARINVGDHLGIWACRGQQFENWLAHRFWESERRAPASHTRRAARNVLESIALFDGDEHRLHNRVAFYDDAIWYDLADRECRAVRITAEGWQIVTEPPILFRRYSHQRPQVEPFPGGDLHDFMRFVNLRDPSQALLLLVSLAACLVPQIPHAILLVHGPQGSAKTSLLRMLRRLIDPSITETLALSRKPDEVVQALSHHWAACFDNVTSIPEWIADILCRAATGEGASKRRLYTDDEAFLYAYRRCVALNSINIPTRRPDLLDRSVLFGLGPITPAERKPEEQLWSQFEEAQPALFGAALDVVSRAMAILPTISLPAPPRMADFARWGCAIAKALGHAETEFIDAYDANIAVQNEEVLHSHPVASALAALMERRGEWEGTATQLLDELEKVAREQRISTDAKGWPGAPHVLARRLVEVQPNLAAAGIEVQIGRDHVGRWTCIRRISAQ